MWLRLLIILNFSFLIFNCHSYGQRPIGIAFYDVDRIYDTVPALFYDDADYTPEGRLHWTAERYARKIRNTAAVIDSMALPLVALWGVENEQVVRDIAAACRGDYSYLHRTLNSLDGMDFALLYYGDLFYPTRDEPGRRYLYVEGELGRDTVGLALCGDARMAQWVVRDLRAERPHVKLIVLGRSDLPDPGRWGLRDATRRAEQAGRGTVRRGGLPKATFSHAAIWLTKRAVTPSRPTPAGFIAAATVIRFRYSFTSGRIFWIFRKVFVFSQSLRRKCILRMR